MHYVRVRSESNSELYGNSATENSTLDTTDHIFTDSDVVVFFYDGPNTESR
jgi:hypothetical protein